MSSTVDMAELGLEVKESDQRQMMGTRTDTSFSMSGARLVPIGISANRVKPEAVTISAHHGDKRVTFSVTPVEAMAFAKQLAAVAEAPVSEESPNAGLKAP